MSVFSVHSLPCFEATSNLKAEAELFHLDVGRASKGESDVQFEVLLEAHRKRLSSQTVLFLPDLCFEIQGSADDLGARYVLWRPLVFLLRQRWALEIEEWLCGGEVAIAFATHEMLGLLEEIVPIVERQRRGQPYCDPLSSLNLVLDALSQLEELLSRGSPYFETIQFLHVAFRSFIRVSSKQARETNEQLLQAARYAPDWSIRVCLEFLEAVRGPTRGAEIREVMLASERSLAVDWLTAEEDEAWQHL